MVWAETVISERMLIIIYCRPALNLRHTPSLILAAVFNLLQEEMQPVSISRQLSW